MNESIVEQTPVVLERVASRLDPGIEAADVPGLAGGFGEIIERWRADSWASGVDLARRLGADRQAAEAALDERTATQARVVMTVTQYVGTGGLAERDQHCLDNIPT